MHFTLNKVKIPSILEKAIIREERLMQFKQHRWGVYKIGCISLEVGVYYVIYGSRLYVQLKFVLSTETFGERFCYANS